LFSAGRESVDRLTEILADIVRSALLWESQHGTGAVNPGPVPNRPLALTTKCPSLKWDPRENTDEGTQNTGGIPNERRE